MLVISVNILKFKPDYSACDTFASDVQLLYKISRKRYNEKRTTSIDCSCNNYLLPVKKINE